MGKVVTRAAQLRAEAEALREKLNDEISPMTRHRVQTLIDELEAQARALGNGDAGEPGATSLGHLPLRRDAFRKDGSRGICEVPFVAVV